MAKIWSQPSEMLFGGVGEGGGIDPQTNIKIYFSVLETYKSSSVSLKNCGHLILISLGSILEDQIRRTMSKVPNLASYGENDVKHEFSGFHNPIEDTYIAVFKCM